jgi:hypothetical protein
MDILSIAIIVAVTFVFDDVFNNRLQIGSRLLKWWSDTPPSENRSTNDKLNVR